MVRFAFTMIELIFAILVIGISVISLPTMTNITNKGIENNLVQEAIFAASAELMGSTSGYWDEKSMQDINTSPFSRVIDIDNDCDVNTRLRAGHIAQPYHRRCLDSNVSSGLGQTTDDDIYSLDDAAHGYEDIFVDTTTSANGYKQTYKSKVTVDLNTTDHNIKNITITIKDENNNIITLLRAKSANIGEIDYYKRRF